MSTDATEGIPSSPITGKISTCASLQEQCLSCSAFSVPFKLLALALIACTLLWAWELHTTATSALSLQTNVLIITCLSIMLYTGGHMFISKTTLDSTGLQQSWIWNKRVKWSDVVYVKIIRVHHLEWLIAPRLCVKTLSGRVVFFYAAQPAMWAAFERIGSKIKVPGKRG